MPARSTSGSSKGRSRQDGVRAVLAARRLSVPEGTPQDGPGQLTLYGLAARRAGSLRPAAEAWRRAGLSHRPWVLLHRLRRAGLPTAVVTASRNSEWVLQAAGVRELFDAMVDGNDVERLGLPGEPDPALYVEAAHRLGVPPAECLVAEDAVAGVQAARRGGFALVVGVDRIGNRSGTPPPGRTSSWQIWPASIFPRWSGAPYMDACGRNRGEAARRPKERHGY